MKNYIASLPAPNTQRRPFKKHTSMPSCISTSTLAESAGGSSRQQLEHEYFEYKRQSQHHISELEKKVQVALAMITQANNENFDLMDQIVSLERRNLNALIKDTPEVVHSTGVAAAAAACTPKKMLPPLKGRLLATADDTTGSFIGPQAAMEGRVATLTPVPMEPSVTSHGRRNLSFNSSADLTRRSGSGTDSGINSSGGGRSGDGMQRIPLGESGAEEDDELADLNEQPRTEKQRKGKRKRIKRYLTRLVCCGMTEATTAATAEEGWPKITYKKL